MLKIQPFKGVIYNRKKVNEADVVAPPYDVINLEKQQELYDRHPNNVVRLILGKTYEEDNTDSNRYTRARDFYESWREEGNLVKLEEDAFYIYEQVYFIGEKKFSRHGFMAAVKLEDFEKGIILPHEKTLPKAQTDRLMLLRACKVNFSPIFALYSDKEKSFDKLLESPIKETLFDISDDDDVEHKLSKITDEKAIGQLQGAMSDKILYIADGHHRYKTALAYRDEMREKTGGASGPWDYVLMMLVNTYCDGLTVLPANRLVKGISDQKRKEFVDLLLNYFSIERVDKDINDFVEELEKAGRDKHAFGLYLPRDEKFILTLPRNADLSKIISGKAKSLRELDVTILHELIFNSVLELPENAAELGSYIKYAVDVEEVVSKVESREYQMAFFLNPTRIEQVQAVADEGEIMPQKSTYFYPKLLSGLVMRPLED